MIDRKKVSVVLPAYNAGRTLERTLREIPPDIVDDIILVDDFSTDDTVEVARRRNLFVFRHDRNKGYGGNQKTCYRLALERGADLVIMLHPDYEYSPKLLLPMASLLGSGFFDVVLGSRILGIGALVIQIHFQWRADSCPEPAARSQAVGISHRLPRFYPTGLGGPAARPQFG